MKSSFCRRLAVISIAWNLLATSAYASQITISSVVDQSGFVGPQNLGSYPLTGTPYDFNGQVNSFALITSVDNITVTLSLLDGDSAVGDFDFGSLTLGLDGINTGLVLNGFSDNNIQTLTLNKLSPALQASLISAFADGLFVGSVIDSTPGNAPVGDLIGLPFRVQTSLEVLVNTSRNPPPLVPLPAAILVAPLGVGLAAVWSRRMRGRA